MHKNYTVNSDNCSGVNKNQQPVALSSNKKILNNKEKQEKQKIFDSSLKITQKPNQINNNDQLLKQLYLLLQNKDVRKNMSTQLQNRVKRVIDAVEQEQQQEMQCPQNQEDDDQNLFSKPISQEDQYIRPKAAKQSQNNNINRNLNKRNNQKFQRQQQNPIFVQNLLQQRQKLFQSNKLKRQIIKNKENIDNKKQLNIASSSQIKNRKIPRNLTNQNSQSKQKKKQENTKCFSRNNKSQKSLLKNVKGYTISTNNKPNTKVVQVRSKSKQERLIDSKSAKSLKKFGKNLNINKKTSGLQEKSAANTIKKFNTDCNKNPSSLFTTQFTTRNCQADLKLFKQNILKNPSLERLCKQKRSTSKTKKLKTDHSLQKMKSKNSLKLKERNYTQQEHNQQENRMEFADRQMDEQLLFCDSPYQNLKKLYQDSKKFKKNTQSYDKSKQKKSQKNYLTQQKIKMSGQFEKQYQMNFAEFLQQSCSIQFLERIFNIQKQIKIDQNELQNRLKVLKNNILVQKSKLQAISNQVSKIKQQQSNININSVYLANKKNQNHKKLQQIWTQVKSLNSSIVQSNKQNQQILNNLKEQKQLVQMYNTVIEELKQQLKIQVDQRDEYKKLLKQSKKSEMASRIKANTTKQKTEFILGNVRSSINKWI